MAALCGGVSDLDSGIFAMAHDSLALPTLTSAMQNFEDSGCRAAEMLGRLFRGEKVDPPIRVLPEAILAHRHGK